MADEKTDIDYTAQGYRDGLKGVHPQHEHNHSYMAGYERAIDRQVRKEMQDINDIFN